MVDELKKHIERRKIFFGIKQCLKKYSDLEKVKLASDSRESIKNLLEANKIKFEVLNFTKGELSNKFGLGFHCEVFGLKK